MIRLSRAGAALFVALGIAGCQNDALPTAPSMAPAPTRAAVAASGSRNDRLEEAVFAEMAAETPGFAGFYFNRQGRMIVRVVRDEERGRARASMMKHAGRQKDRALRAVAAGDFDFERADYSFTQLAGWRDLVFNEMLGTDGVLSDDVDEERNRVTIGISRKVPGAQGRATAKLTSLDIPLAAVRFVDVEPREFLRPASSASSTMGAGESIRDYYTSIGGGYRIYPSGCTATIVGTFRGERVLATASHCTTYTYSPDGGPLQSPSGISMGVEAYDPYPTSDYCYAWLWCHQARGSDGALFSLNTAMASEPGAIARLNVRSRTLPTTTDFRVNTSQPWWYVTGVGTWHVAGMEVDKVGVTTGWTYGYIVQTCEDTWVGDYAVRCSNEVDIAGAGGDSGSPFFRRNDPGNPNDLTVTLLGTQSWGGNQTGTYNGQKLYDRIGYTNMTSLDQELGYGLNVLTTHTMGAVELVGAIESGSGTLNWNAVTATGMSGPVEYRIYMSQSFMQVDQEGRLYTWNGTPQQVATTTATSWQAGGYTTMDCTVYDEYQTVERYYVEAYTNGIRSSSNEVCFSN